MKSCIIDANGLLLDITETRESMITITVKKHLSKKLRPVFAMLHRLEGVMESSSIPKQGGQGVTQSKKEDPKPSFKPTVKCETAPKGKEKIFNEESIIDNSEEKEPDKNELKRRKEREAQMDEHQIIIREAEAKEKVEREAQVMLESRKLLFPVWTLKRIQNEAVDMTSQYWLEPVVSFNL
ncbi:unnamed protein product [Lactuca saligna]|uniref:Uncharacterized protein n=1 Tax=Lactuca saligna TaxID=75948 RepID=A0AA35YWH3_LACSI|nr:unnamed protein product [Lactuca saligna]